MGETPMLQKTPIAAAARVGYNPWQSAANVLRFETTRWENCLADLTSAPPLVVYVDVDDTLVRSVGRERIPMPETIEHVRALRADGAQLFCWSSGGGEYARASAEELGIADCFLAFLPKPHVLVDDQAVGTFRALMSVHPARCTTESVATYRAALGSERPSRP